MFKGIIDYQNGKIPFIIDNYQMNLFSEKELVTLFVKEHNFKTNYILTGQCFDIGNTPRDITLLVEKSMGSTCYITCFIVNNLSSDKKIDSINFESRLLDSIFRYKYHYLDLSRAGVNLAAEQTEIYSIPFNICRSTYELKYLIGQNHRMGLLESFRMRGKTSILLQTAQIEECYRVTLLMNRFSKFITSTADVSFERITLSANGFAAANFYCKCVSNNSAVDLDVLFCEFPVMKYTARILDNLAFELDSKITKSIPLGHLTNYDNRYTPHRFIEQVTAFEYLFEKLEPEKAKSSKFSLKTELKLMFDAFPEILNGVRINSDEIANRIKELRRNIVHGYAYYYDFNNDSNIQFCIIKIADLIQRMSLKLIGFDNYEISEFRKIVIAY
jgi:hypothetical protein